MQRALDGSGKLDDPERGSAAESCPVIDLHCHILPGIDDGAATDDVSLAMARAFVEDGVTTVACTPHILPGLYHNTGPQILAGVTRLQQLLDDQDIPLRLVGGADVVVRRASSCRWLTRDMS